MKINPYETASFDVDCQNTFTPLCPDELPVQGGDEVIPELNAQANYARYRIGSKDAHCPHAAWIATQENPPFSKIEAEHMDTHFPRHAEPGTYGFELIAGLPAVTDYDYFVWKGVEPDMHPYGNCYHDFAEKLSTGVIEFLQAKQVTTVLVGGLTTEYCVKNTVLQLCRAKFRVIVNLAACRGIEKTAADAALVEMQQAGALLVPNAQALMV